MHTLLATDNPALSAIDADYRSLPNSKKSPDWPRHGSETVISAEDRLTRSPTSQTNFPPWHCQSNLPRIPWITSRSPSHKLVETSATCTGNYDRITAFSTPAKPINTCLQRHGLKISMGRVRTCANNASAERVFGQLKRELVRRCQFRTRQEATDKINQYFLNVYNPWRRTPSRQNQPRSVIELNSRMDYEAN